MSRTACLIATLATLAPAPAGAHGLDEPPGAQAPLFEDGVFLGVGADYGLVLLEDAPVWVAEESLPAAPTHWLSVKGGVLAGTNIGLYRTEDAGCSWTQEIPDADVATVTGLLREAEGVLG